MIIEYSPSRVDVWCYYWAKWRRELWKIHAVWLSAYSMSALVVLNTQYALNFHSAFLAFMVGVLALLMVSCYPQIRYRSQERSLSVKDDGLRLQRESVYKLYTWNDIANLNCTRRFLLIEMTNGNALIIPRRSFANGSQETAFEAQVGAKLKR